MIHHLVNRAFFANDSLPHDHHIAGKRGHHIYIVADKQNRQALAFVGVSQEVHHPRLGVPVERARRLIC